MEENEADSEELTSLERKGSDGRVEYTGKRGNGKRDDQGCKMCGRKTGN